MDTLTQAQIYLADQRGCEQDQHHQSLYTFTANREPVGALYQLADHSLLAGQQQCFAVDWPADNVLIPLVGGLEYNSALGNGFLEPGQVLIFSSRSGFTYSISNPYETEMISYLQLGFRADGITVPASVDQLSVELPATNQLHPLFTLPNTSNTKGYIGRFDGRAEGTYSVRHTANQVFVYVLNGVFEVQNRLLHNRDGLSLANIQQPVEFEALSNGAILLLLELPDALS